MRFISGEGTFRDDLGEKLFGEVADDVDALGSIDVGAAVVMDVGQVRVRKLCGSGPAGEAIF